MTDESEPQKPAPNDTKPCRVCGEDIKRNASKCIHCGSWQDRRLFLAAAPLTISLLTNLVSVTLLALPIINAPRANSNFQASFQAANETELSILVANTGTRAGSLIGAYLVLSTELVKGDVTPDDAFPKKLPILNLDPVSSSKQAALYIPPGIGSPIELTSIQRLSERLVTDATMAKITPQHTIAPAMGCRLALLFRNFDGVPIYRYIDSPCFVFAKFLQGHIQTRTPSPN